MKIKCDQCQIEFNKVPSKIKPTNFCSRKCFSDFHRVEGDCSVCGKYTKRVKSKTENHDNLFCSYVCFKEWARKRLSGMCKELNPTRMKNLGTRIKLRRAHVGKGEGRTYPKMFGRHAHRVVMEEKLQRALLPGEVVHHKDEDKTNYHPDNLQLLDSQSTHARGHALKSGFGQINKKSK